MYELDTLPKPLMEHFILNCQALYVDNSCPGIASYSILHQDNVIWGNLNLKVRNVNTKNNLFVVLKVCTLNIYNFSICAHIY